MDKAIRTIALKNSYGKITMIETEEGVFCFRAYETANFFGFADEKACIRKYANKPFLVLMETDGGKQPVKCINIEDVAIIAQHSRMTKADLMAANLLVAIRNQRIMNLEMENICLRDDLEYALDGLKGLKEQLNTILDDLIL